MNVQRSEYEQKLNEIHEKLKWYAEAQQTMEEDRSRVKCLEELL